MTEDRTMTGFGDERATLLRYLGQYRSTLASKCADLDGAIADADVLAHAWRSWRDETACADRFVGRETIDGRVGD